MDTAAIRSDDFAGLLAALSKSVNPSFLGVDSATSSSSAPAFAWNQQQQLQQQQQQQPLLQPLPMQMQTQQFPHSSGAQVSRHLSAAPFLEAGKPKKAKASAIIIISVICLAVLLFAVIAWMRSSRMQELQEDEEEEENANDLYAKKARKESKEIPPPSSALAKKRHATPNKKVDFFLQAADSSEHLDASESEEYEQEQHQKQHKKKHALAERGTRGARAVIPQKDEYASEEEYSSEENEVSSYVSRNLRQFAKQQQGNIIDISGFDLPTEYVAVAAQGSSSAYESSNSATTTSPTTTSLSNTRNNHGRIVADESKEVLAYAKKRDALFKDE